MSTQNVITLGCDPEVFVRNIATDKVVPICGLLGGTKAAPKQMTGMVKGFAYQEDGPAAELNIPVCNDSVQFARSSKSALNFLSERLSEKNLAIDDARFIELPEEWLRKHPNLAAIGCDPDYCAYDSASVPRPGLPLPLQNIRGAGGHIHVGYPVDMIPAEILVQFIDLTVALPTLKADAQGKRRQWWGQAGIFRHKTYGLEYRSLSNFWLLQTMYAQCIAQTIFDLVDSIQKRMPEWVSLYNAVPWKTVQALINSGNGKTAMEYIVNLRKTNKLLSDLTRAGL